jgi:alanine racemase
MDAKHSLGEPRVLISRDALLHNAALLRKTLGPQTKICAMIKADAYGHGADLVIDTLHNFSTDDLEGPMVDAFAVASIDEAALLPVTTLPLLIFRPVENCFLGRQKQRLEMAIRQGWVLTICTAAAAGDLARIAQTLQKRANVQIMIDTGMTRVGVLAEDFAELLGAVLAQPALRLAGLATHFAQSEEAHSTFTLTQFERFSHATDEPIRRLSSNVLRHVANTGAIFFHPQCHLDMVRPGIGLYGIDPTGRPSMQRPLAPVLKWTAPLVGIKAVKQGTGVGYAQSWHAPRDTRIGLVSIGYGDGYLRAMGNVAMMLVHGKTVPVVGRISMDLTTIDLGACPEAAIGDEVTVLDNNPLSPCSAYALAQWAGTIPYEIFTRIGSRIHRVAAEVEEPAPKRI